MYQFSLAYFGRMFRSCVENSGQSEDVPERLKLLGSYTTEFVFKNVSRGLFEEHKGLFSFLLASSIARHPSAGEVSDAEWGFFLRGAPAGGADGGGGAPKRPEWAAEAAWRGLVYLEGAVPALGGLTASMAAGPDADAWRAWWVGLEDWAGWPDTRQTANCGGAVTC